MSRANGYGSYRSSDNNSRPEDRRPNSETLVDLHVYLVPPDIWRGRYNNLLNKDVTEAVSAGIIRVHPEQKVTLLRDEIDNQIGTEEIPKDYVFLKGVGRSITKLRPRQEYQLKVKNFIPPLSIAPEIFLLETQDIDESHSSVRAESPEYNQENDNISRRSVGGKRSYNPSPRYNQYSPVPKNSQKDLSPRHRHSPAQTSLRPDYIDDHHSSSSHRLDQNGKGGRYEEVRDDPSPSRYKSRPRDGDNQNTYNHKQNGNDRPLSASWGSSQGHSRRKSPPHSRHPPDEISAPPLSATPPPLTEKPSYRKAPPHRETYTNHTNEDSGIEGLTPEDHYRENNYDDVLDRRKKEEEEKRRSEQELQQRLKAEAENEERQRRRLEEQDRLDWERRQKEEAEKRQREEEERRKLEEEERRKEEEERRLREQEREKMSQDKLSASDEELNRFPSPPSLNMPPPPAKGDNSSRHLDKADKEQLMRELEQAREARKQMEKNREDLVKKAKMLQNKMQNRRNHARDLWKKRYFEEKKRTSPLEEQCNRLRHELEIIHRRLMNTLEGPTNQKVTRVGELKPSIQSNYKIQATRLLHEIDDIKRRLENAKMKLTAEMKLRNQAETELRAMRAELTQKKINLTLTRNQQLAGLGTVSVTDSYIPHHAITPRS